MRSRASHRLRTSAITCMLVVLALPLMAAVPEAVTSLPRAHAVPGGIAVVALPPPIRQARYDGHRVMVLTRATERYAVIGIPLGTPAGVQTLQATLDGRTQAIHFHVGTKRYATQRITIKNKGMVTLSPANLARVRRESRQIDAVYDHFTPHLYATFPFSLPVRGPETSPFGVKRILNGKPRAPHSGIDIAARAGTPVRAPAAGVVALTGNFFFNGRTVILNHGQGLVSVYVHLRHIAVHQGERVARGQVLGQVGATGRTTGADLHWTVTLNGTKVNPELLLSNQELRELGR